MENWYEVIVGDCIKGMQSLEAGSVHTCVTSPPYFGLRDYQNEGQIGLEQTPEEYVARLVEVFREVRRVLRDDGTLWLNLGSTYASRGMSASQSRQPQRDPAYDNHGKALLGCSAPDCAYRGHGDAPLGDLQSHHGHISGNVQPRAEAAAPADKKDHDSGLPGSSEASPDVSPRASLVSKTRASFRRDRAAYVPVGGASASPPSPQSSVPDVQVSVHTSACTCGTGSTSGPSAPNTSGKSSLGLACDCGSCGICWANLAIPLLSIKAKDSIEIPHLVAFALQADGWYLRQDIIWHKPNPMPESVSDRCTKAHEYVFLLSKSARYYFDAEAIKEPANPANYRANATKRAVAPGQTRQGKLDAHRGTITCETRNRRSVWTVTTKPFKGAHFATFPPDLIEPCVLAGAPAQCCVRCGAPHERVVEKGEPNLAHQIACGGNANGEYHGIATKDYAAGKAQDASATKARILAGMRARVTVGFDPTCTCNADTAPGVVLDPFGGSGTTAGVALKHGRNAILCELNPDYDAMIDERVDSIRFGKPKKPAKRL